MRTIHIWAAAMCLMLMAACSQDAKVANGQFPFLDKLGITCDAELLLGDTISMPDIYCGDATQSVDDLKGKRLDPEQYEALIVPAGPDFADTMSNWLLLGVRDVGGGNTLAAYYACNGMGYCVDLITYDKQGNILDAINARELHLLWRCDLKNPKDDNTFTLDGFITFDGPNRLTLHRTMGRCLMDFDGDLKGKPQWSQQWQQQYFINPLGHFVLQGQQVSGQQGDVDQYAVLDFKSWDMLICSRHDPAVMDVWNDYSELVNSTYDPDYEYNPFPWDISELYKMNPQRFLKWMAAHRGKDNRLLPQFKLPVDERPALLEEIKRLDDSSARQWLTDLVNSWDDKPLTKHL